MAAKICGKCGLSVYPLEAVAACEKFYHKQCFRCKHCDMVITLKNFAAIAGEPYCKPHYLSLFKTKGNYDSITGDTQTSSSYNSSQGFKGFGAVMDSVKDSKKDLKKVETVDKSAPQISSDVHIKKVDRHGLLEEVAQEHELKHAETVDKSAPHIENVPIKKIDRNAFLFSIQKGPEQPLEKPTATSDRSSPVVIRNKAPQTCAKCGKTVYPLEALQACDKTYHKGCFRCKHCDGPLSLKGFATIGDEPYCKPHYQQLFKMKGNYDSISGGGTNEGSSSFTPAFKGFS